MTKIFYIPVFPYYAFSSAFGCVYVLGTCKSFLTGQFCVFLSKVTMDINDSVAYISCLGPGLKQARFESL